MTSNSGAEDRTTLEEADFAAIRETFQSCSVGDRVTLTSHYPSDNPSDTEHFDYAGEVVEADAVNGMPGLVIESSDPNLPPEARVIDPLNKDRSLDIRFVGHNGSVTLAGWVTSLSIKGDPSRGDGE